MIFICDISTGFTVCNLHLVYINIVHYTTGCNVAQVSCLPKAPLIVAIFNNVT